MANSVLLSSSTLELGGRAQAADFLERLDEVLGVERREQYRFVSGR